MSFWSYAGSVGTQVLILFILMAVGFVATKVGLITEKGSAQLVDLLLYIVTPAVIINAFLQMEYTKERLTYIVIMAGCVLLVHLLGFAVALPVFCRAPLQQKSILRLSVVFSNCGFMSLPLASALFGPEGVFLVSIYVVMHNVIVWTAGVALFPGGHISVVKAILNPGTIGVAVGLPLFLLGVHLPEAVLQPIGYIADLNTPVAMLAIGYFMAGTILRPQKGDDRVLLVSLLRLVAVPLLALCLLRALPVPRLVFLACMLPACAPTAANAVMFAEKFGGDTDCGARIISISTLLSALSMPLLLSAAQMVSRG